MALPRSRLHPSPRLGVARIPTLATLPRPSSDRHVPPLLTLPRSTEILVTRRSLPFIQPFGAPRLGFEILLGDATPLDTEMWIPSEPLRGIPPLARAEADTIGIAQSSLLPETGPVTRLTFISRWGVITAMAEPVMEEVGLWLTANRG